MVKTWVFWPTKCLAQAVFSPFFSIRAQGRENLPKETGFILLPKHQRWVDIPLLSLAASRPLYYVAKYELFKISPVGWYLKSLGGIPLNRGQPVRTKSYL
jgi:1-acyl-sn-glycerol-3-phosphate acyltransferase